MTAAVVAAGRLQRSDGVETALSTFEQRGVALLRSAGARHVAALVEQLGAAIHVEDVVVERGARALLKSDVAIGLHTDHHRARVIVWHCLAQASEGGETILVDGLAALSTLSPEAQATLATVELQEHSIFARDVGHHSLLTQSGNQRLLYYSLWLVDRLSDEQRACVEAFEDALRAAQVTRIRLQPGDALVIDNRRMLHGRTAIAGDRHRHLKRFWLA